MKMLKALAGQLLVIIFFSLLLCLSTVHNVIAGTTVVTSTSDSGPGSLRHAIALASDGDKIIVTAQGTITLASGELVVDKNLTIRGPGSGKLTVSGNRSSRVFLIVPNVSVSIEGIKITNGFATGPFPQAAGGGIYSDQAQLTINNCVITDNEAQFGGGIFSNSASSTATLTINNSTLSGNIGQQFGGGIFSGGFFGRGPDGTAYLILNESSFEQNRAGYGGAIFNDGFLGEGIVSVKNSSFDRNKATSGGGAIYNNGDSGTASITLIGTSISRSTTNGSGGGIYNDGLGSVRPGDARVSLTESVVRDCYAIVTGGGIASDGTGGSALVSVWDSEIVRNASVRGGGISSKATDGSAALYVTNSDVNQNGAEINGGGFLNQGELIITNSTVKGNFAQTDGGAVHNDGEVTLSGTSLSSNHSFQDGGGVYNTGTGFLNVTDSTINGNTAGGPLFGFYFLGRGGAIFNNAESSPLVRIINSTLSGNSTNDTGGAIANRIIGSGFITVTIDNCTFKGNSATNGGGTFSNSFLVDDELPPGYSMLDIANTIFNDGVSTENIQVSFGEVVSRGHNLSSDAAGGDGSTGPGGMLTGPGDIRNTDPLLGPLKNNGGPTQTHALLLGSPAINAGDPNFNPSIFEPPMLFDQRGRPGFWRVVNGRIDIGAFESKHF